MQYWKKIAWIEAGDVPGYSHASVPVAVPIGDGTMRVYFSRRRGVCSLPFCLDLDPATGSVGRAVTAPLFELGETGAFDDSGVMPTCMVRTGSSWRMYYIGWNQGVTVPFRNAVGIAVSDDGHSFRRLFRGPVLDRNRDEPHFVASCDVLQEDGAFRVWYVNCIGWNMLNGALTHYYHIKYAESADGIDWKREGRVAIGFHDEDEFAISVPRVMPGPHGYAMWYSYRSLRNGGDYRIGYAESADGRAWTRLDDRIRIDGLDDRDNRMQCYPFVFDAGGRRYMLYNGNGYGETGMALAVLEE